MTSVLNRLVHHVLLAIPFVFLIFTSCMFATSAYATKEEEIAPTPGWELIGTCEWQIDDSGCLNLRPANNADKGVFEHSSYELFPWIGGIREDIPNWNHYYALTGSKITDFRVSGQIEARGNLGGMFEGCINLETIVFPQNFNTENVVSTYNMFFNCRKLREIDLSNFDTRNMQSMCSMFEDCESLQSLDLSSFDTSKVNNMSFMFAGCIALKEINIDNFDTSQVEDMRNMFAYCSSIPSLDLKHFNTEKLRTMDGMFAYCSTLTELDLSSFNTSNVTEMSTPFIHHDPMGGPSEDGWERSGLFKNCSSLKSINLSSFNTSKTRSFYEMFNGCSALESIDLSNFDTSSLCNSPFGLAGMFNGCKKLKSIDISTFDTSNFDISYTAGYEFMFDSSLESITLGTKFTLQCALPDKTWYNTKGEAFTPATIPSGVADTYRTSSTVPVYSVTVSPTAKTVLRTDAPFTITATVSPADAFNGAIAWSSSNTSVATVDARGRVTPVSAGTTSIQASAGGITAQCMLTVIDPQEEIIKATSVVLDKSTLTLSGKATSTLSATIAPSNVTLKGVVWSSSDEKVVHVSADGTLTAVGKGTATIIATSQDGNASATCTVEVLNPPTNVNIEALPRQMKYGSSYELQALLTGELAGATEAASGYAWSVADPSIALIEPDGSNAILTCLNVGQSSLTVKALYNGTELVCSIPLNITWPDPESIALNESAKVTIVSGDAFSLSATISPIAAANNSITWASTNPQVASVDEHGTVSPLRRGQTSITAQIGNISASCLVTVEGRSLPVADDSDLNGFLMIDDSETAEQLAGMKLRIIKSKLDSDMTIHNALLSNAQDGSSFINAYDIDLVDSNGEVHPWSDPNHAVSVYIELDKDTLALNNTHLLVIHYVNDDASNIEHKNTWVENGSLAFSTTHFSTYALTATPRPVDTGNPLPDNPPEAQQNVVGGLAQTGDDTNTVVLALSAISLVVIAGLIIAMYERGRISRHRRS